MTAENNNMVRTRLLNSAVLRCCPKPIKPLIAEFETERVGDRRLSFILSELSSLDSRIAKLFAEEEKLLQVLIERSKEMTARSRGEWV